MWRYLAGNKTSEGPRHIFSVDTETVREPEKPGSHWSIERLRMGVVRYCRLEGGRPKSGKILAFDKSDQFWQFLERHAEPRSMAWVFAHGVGFDLRVLGWQQGIDSGRLLLRKWRLDSKKSTPSAISTKPETGLLVLDGVPTIVECWLSTGARVRIVDTRNWWPCKLAELGEATGLPKLAMPEPWDSLESWLTYCQRDCEIVEASAVALLNWTREHDLGVFKPTAPGQALQAYRHRFHSRKIVLHDNPEVKQLERASYYAGRLEMFYCGRIERSDRGVKGMLFDKFDEQAPRPVGAVYKLDVNGLFPSVMRGNLFPRRLKSWNSTYDLSRPESSSVLARSVASVLLRNCCVSLPQREKGKVTYYTGTLRTTLAGPDLVAALENSESMVVEAIATYEVDELFTSYVDFFQQLRYMARLAGKTLEAKLCKLMLNSLYGKFAQRSFEWETLPRVMPPEPWANWHAIDAEARTIREYRAIGDLVQVRCDRGDHPNSFCAISAFVTAFARRRMDELRAIAGPHNVYYQGVDSLFVSAMGLERLQAAGEVDDCQLGKLRIEGESSDTEFLAKGIYRFAGQWTLTSVRGDAKQIADLEFEQDQFQSLAESVADPPLDGVRVQRIHKRLATQPGEYDLTPAGWVRPRRAIACEPSQSAAEEHCTSSPFSTFSIPVERDTFGMACGVGN